VQTFPFTVAGTVLDFHQIPVTHLNVFFFISIYMITNNLVI
jgi:hypothetical protein